MTQPPLPPLDAMHATHGASPAARAIIGAERDLQRAFAALVSAYAAHDTSTPDAEGNRRYVVATQLRARGQELAAVRTLRAMMATATRETATMATSEAQWFKNGDHPDDACRTVVPVPGDGEPYLSEGKVVRRFCHPVIRGGIVCPECNEPMRAHGWIDSGGKGQTVCPGDFVRTVGDGKYTVHGGPRELREPPRPVPE